MLDAIPYALKAMDQPTIEGLNTFLIARQIRAAGIKVALSGLGGDELFAGYSTFRFWSVSGAEKPHTILRRRRIDGHRPQTATRTIGERREKWNTRRKFVPTQTRERHLDPGGSNLSGDEERIETFDRGLVHGLERVGDGIQYVALRDHNGLMLRGKSSGYG